MKPRVLLCLVAALAMLAGAVSGQAAGDASKDAVTADFTCPMHPEVKQIGPGKCPICHMDLVPSGGAESTSSTTGTTSTTATTGTTTM